MKLLLDTNIIVDILSGRAGCAESLNVLRCCELGRAKGLISVSTVLDVMYILRKHISHGDVREAVRSLVAIVDVADVKRNDISGAFESDMTDFEDAVQALCAKRNKADYIVTRNIGDYQMSPVPAILPSDILKLL